MVYLILKIKIFLFKFSKRSADMTARYNNIKKTHVINSYLNLFLSITVVICVFAGTVINLLSAPTELVEEVGIKTFRMFTVLSNIFVGICASMSIPFAVDGIRNRNYHLPRWVIGLTLSGVTCVALTFIITLCVLSPQVNFVRMMLHGSNLLLHTVVPIVSIVSFLFINTYHTIPFKTTLLAMIPIAVYATIYLISAIIIGEENGGWRDHYHFEELMPPYAVLILILILSFGLANALRALHNLMHRRDKAATEKYYLTSPEYDSPTIEDAIRKMASEDKKRDGGGEVTVPRRMIRILEKRYDSHHTLSYLCGVYLDEYLK